MRNRIKTGLAVLVIVASLAFTTIGIARAATGYRWNPRLPGGMSLFSVSSASETAEPTETIEPSDTPEPTETVEPSETAEPPEMESEDSQDNGPSFDHEEDNGNTIVTPPAHEHKSGTEGSGGRD